MKKYIIIITALLSNSYGFSQNPTLLVDKEWEIREYSTEVSEQRSVLYNSDSINNINDLDQRGFEFKSNGTFDEINNGNIDGSGNWEFNTPQDSLTIRNNKYKVTVLTQDSLVLKTSGRKYGLDIDAFLKLVDKQILSTNDLSLVNNLEIYPNPTDGVLNLKVKNYMTSSLKALNIYSVLGKHISTLAIEKSNNQQVTLKGLPHGIYFIKVINNENTVIAVKKVVFRK